jgi:uncharacterized protein (DUF885 family)
MRRARHDRSIPGALRALAAGGALWAAAAGAATDALEPLAADFWRWRAAQQPASGDDIPRIDRPAGWRPDWSRAAIERRLADLERFEARWREVDPSAWSVPRQVDYRLLGSAIARVRWELVVAPGWRRNPLFYVDQTLGALFESLLAPPPFDAARAERVLSVLASVPDTVGAAEANLDDARAPFARLAIDALAGAEERLATVARELAPELPAERRALVAPAAREAGRALAGLRAWLEARLPALAAETAVGRDAYLFFLREVALVPFAPERLVEMGRQEWARSVAFEAYETNRNRHRPPLGLPANRDQQIATMERDMVEVRRFLARERLLGVPEWVRYYRLRPKPAYLAPLAALGVNNDFSGPGRLAEDGAAWIDEPSPSAGYFYRAYAADPRTQIAHESHGHYLQLVLSWAHEDWIRRHYYDSGANEGIAFYNEELMLQAGLFDDRPRVREVIYNFARLRALRVEIDVGLALGTLTIEAAAEQLATRVPMDAETALDEAAFFASAPGQAISYQIGKLQILALLADARLAQGEAFSLRAFHDFLWKNGNLPLALLRWELLGDRSELDALDTWRRATISTPVPGKAGALPRSRSGSAGTH